MKSLQESLFNNDLISKELFSDPKFKKWINRPDALLCFWQYWNSGWDDPFIDMMDDWEKYKSLVDAIIAQDCIEMLYYGYMRQGEDLEDIFGSEEAYESWLEYAIDEIKRKSDDDYANVWRTRFKGSLPKGSSVTEFIITILQYENNRNFGPGKIKGGIFVTDEDSILVIFFKNNTPQEILKLFDIK